MTPTPHKSGDAPELVKRLQQLKHEAEYRPQNYFNVMAAEQKLRDLLFANLDTILASLQPSEMAKALMTSAIAEIVHEEAQEYEFRDPDYTPTDFERMMLEDFGLGLLERIAASPSANSREKESSHD
ncbi:hypothetical protein [Microvirga sp. P5_D2]